MHLCKTTEGITSTPEYPSRFLRLLHIAASAPSAVLNQDASQPCFLPLMYHFHFYRLARSPTAAQTAAQKYEKETPQRLFFFFPPADNAAVMERGHFLRFLLTQAMPVRLSSAVAA